MKFRDIAAIIWQRERQEEQAVASVDRSVGELREVAERHPERLTRAELRKVIAAEKDDEDWDVIDVPHTLIRKTSSSNNDSKKKNIRLPPPPCEEENLDHYVRAMFTDKQ